MGSANQHIASTRPAAYTPHGIRIPNDHPDIEQMRLAAALRGERDASPTRQPWIAMLVSRSWQDTDWLETFIDKTAKKYPRATIVHTGKRETQTTAIDRAELHNLRCVQTQMLHVTWLADIIMCFWGGTPDTVKDVMKKAQLCHRPASQFYPGLHVYETVRSKKNRAGAGGGQTGTIQHRVRHSFDLVDPTRVAKLIRQKGRL